MRKNLLNAMSRFRRSYGRSFGTPNNNAFIPTGIVSDAIVLEAGIGTYSDTSGTIAITDNGTVAAWKTPGLNAVHATLGPVYHSSGGPGNKPYISFNGSKWLQDTAFVTDKGAFAIFAVTKCSVTSGNTGLFGIGSNALNFYGGGSAWMWVTFPSQTTSPRISMRDYWCLQGIYTNGTNISYYADKEASTGTSGISGNSTGLQVGSCAGAAIYQGDIAAFIVLPRSASAADAAALESQLASYYSLPNRSSDFSLVVVGNSFVANYAASGTSTSWQHVLSGLLTGGVFNVYSLGTSSDTTGDINNRRTYIQNFADRTGARKKVLLIGEGSNDPTAASAFITMIGNIRSSGAYDKIIVVTPLARQNTITTAAIEAFTQTLRDQVSPPWDAFVDWMANPLLGADGAYNNATYFADTIHPTAAGMALMASDASPVVQGIIGQLI